ncbi:pyrroline-5-carboxylate reductase [uncultured Arcticibacterium sp.]|uniref:pyrroline-5-carboxylate reductase n=1 Tax=uncultured Arcticibacterium sp. TaxID=2173042 RepID=UPI0030F6F5B8
MKLLVIGAGNMGLTYAKAINDFGILGDDKIMILDKSPEKLAELRADGVFEVFEELTDCVPQAQMIMVAVKPQHKDGLFEEMKPLVKSDTLIISVMAGVTIDSMQNALGLEKVVRAMPNLPAQLGLGMTTFFAATAVSETEQELMGKLLGSTGKSLKLDKEDDINTSTAIHGSGPAYIFYFMQAMMDAAEHYGYDEATAKLLVTQTFEGAVQQYKEGNFTPTEWMDRVASKGGTTRAALNKFDDENVREGIKKGAIACYDRAIELSKI